MRLFFRGKQSGFTLIESVAVTIIIGVLAAIGIPNFYGIYNQQKLKRATDQLYFALLEAPKQAQRTNQKCTLNFQKGSNQKITKITTPDPGCFPLANQEFSEGITFTSTLTDVVFSFRGMPNKTGTIIVSFPQKVTEQRCIEIVPGLAIIQQGIYQDSNCNLLY